MDQYGRVKHLGSCTLEEYLSLSTVVEARMIVSMTITQTYVGTLVSLQVPQRCASLYVPPSGGSSACAGWADALF